MYIYIYIYIYIHIHISMWEEQSARTAVPFCSKKRITADGKRGNFVLLITVFYTLSHLCSSD